MRSEMNEAQYETMLSESIFKYAANFFHLCRTEFGQLNIFAILGAGNCLEHRRMGADQYLSTRVTNWNRGKFLLAYHSREFSRVFV